MKTEIIKGNSSPIFGFKKCEVGFSLLPSFCSLFFEKSSLERASPHNHKHHQRHLILPTTNPQRSLFSARNESSSTEETTLSTTNVWPKEAKLEIIDFQTACLFCSQIFSKLPNCSCSTTKEPKIHHRHVGSDGLPKDILGKKGNSSSCQEQAFDINAERKRENIICFHISWERHWGCNLVIYTGSRFHPRIWEKNLFSSKVWLSL